MRRVAVLAAALSFAVFTANSAGAHPVHISSTQIDLARNSRALEVTVRMFTDDLEEAIYESAKRRVRFGQTNVATLDSLLDAYLGQRLRLSSKQQPLSGKLLGHERENDAMLVFVEVPISVVPSEIVVENTVLLEMFSDQSNMVHAQLGKQKRSALLRRGEERAVLTF